MSLLWGVHEAGCGLCVPLGCMGRLASMDPSVSVLCFPAGSHTWLLMGAGGSALCHMGLPMGRLSVLQTWWLACPRMGQEWERAPERKEKAYARMSPSQKSHTVTSATFCLLEVSHSVQPTCQKTGIRLHFLKGGMSQDLWAYFKTTATSQMNYLQPKACLKICLAPGGDRQASQEGKAASRWGVTGRAPVAEGTCGSVLLRSSRRHCRVRSSTAPVQVQEQGSWGVPPTL